MYKVGITGGIASGKTTICKIFELLGVPVYYADDRAKQLMTASKVIKHQIITLFGTEAYFKNGRLNRKYIGSIAFNDPPILKKLNAIVHPAVIQDGHDWFEKLKDVPYALKEAALLIESGSYKTLDKTIVVTCLGLGIGCHLTGLHTLKIKETDRLEALRIELTKLGANISVTNDSLTLIASKEINSNVKIATYNDHRMAMSFAPFCLINELNIENEAVVEKSYPAFWEDLKTIVAEKF